MKSNPLSALIANRWSPFFFAAFMATALALLMPPFSGPDEKGHLGYIAALSQGHLPLMPGGMLVDLKTGFTYQAQHPPLFYALATPFFLLAGRDAEVALIMTRVLGVAALLMTIWFGARLAQTLLPVTAARRATWLVAANPILIYICAMANNESLAIALATGCAYYALCFARTRKRSLWLAAALCGGLGLLTKMTAIGGVFAAFVILLSASSSPADADETNVIETTSGERVRPSLWTAFALPVAVVAMWIPWAFISYSHYGTLTPRLFRPLFVGGAGALLLYPFDALQAAFQTLGQFSLGLILPMWLLHGGFWEVPLIYAGFAIGLALAWWTLIRARWRFVGAAFFGVWFLVLMQAYFRDLDALLGASRYVGVAIPLIALVVSEGVEKLPRAAKNLLLGVWIAGISAVYVYYFQFFL